MTVPKNRHRDSAIENLISISAFVLMPRNGFHRVIPASGMGVLWDNDVNIVKVFIWNDRVLMIRHHNNGARRAAGMCMRNHIRGERLVSQSISSPFAACVWCWLARSPLPNVAAV